MRRDRLTGFVAFGAVGVLCTAAVAFGVGMASAKYHLADVGSWLPSTAKGEVVHVNGLSGKVDGKVRLRTPGHDMKIVQQNGVVLIVDEKTGVVSRIDPAQLNVTQSHYQGAAGTQIVSSGQIAYALQPTTGSVQRLDPMTLATVGAPTALPAPLSTAGIAADRTLWVPTPAAGQAARVPGSPLNVGKAGDRISVTITRESAVVVDSTAATAYVVDGATQMRVKLPAEVTRTGRAGALTPGTADGLLVPMLANSSLITLNAATGAISSASVRLPAHRLDPPQILGQRVYIPDQSTGSLIVYDTSAGRRVADVPVTGRPGPLDVYVKDGLLWANSPDTAKAIVVDASGGHKDISKYSGDVPGGNKNPLPKGNLGTTGAPHPGHPGPGGNQPAPAPSPHHTIQPKPPAPGAPQPPSGIVVHDGDGRVSVTFDPSPSDNAEAYTLKVTPAFTGRGARKVAKNGPYSFELTGGKCRPYTFQVVANWKGGRPSASPAVTGRPCVPPGVPTSFAAAPRNQGADLSWRAPAKGTDVTYELSGEGSLNPVRTSGLTSRADGLANNTKHTFTLRTGNPAGDNSVQATVDLAYRPQRIQNANNDETNTLIRSGPSKDSGKTGTIPQGKYVALTVICQTKGGSYTDTESNQTSDIWDLIESPYGNGYLSDTLVATRKGAYPAGSLYTCAN